MSKQKYQASIIIPTLNEEIHIEDCIKSLVDAAELIDEYEILVVDGGSTDNTKNIVLELSNRNKNVRLLENPKKIVPAAMNIGAAIAKFEFLIWCGAHARYDKNYILNSLKVHDREQCSSVGGIIIPTATTTLGRSISAATSSKFGVGSAAYRQANCRQHVPSVFGGCFKKQSLEKIGGFNEKWVRNQDVEFNYRLSKHVGPIVLDPSIKCKYHCRETLSDLAKQYFQYGFWRFNTALRFPKTFSWRLAMPPILVLGMTASIILLIMGQKIGWLVPALYCSFILSGSMTLAFKSKRALNLLSLPLIFIVLHFSWGAGFLKSAIKQMLVSAKSILFPQLNT